VQVLRDGSLAVMVGVLAVIQARINGELAGRLNSGFEAAALSFGAGFVMIAAVVLCNPRGRTGLRTLAGRVRGRVTPRLPWWAMLGGVGGAMFVAAQGLAVPTLGVALFTVAVVAGQTGNSLVADRLGVGPGGRRPVTGPRVFAAVLCVAGVALAVQGGMTDGSFAPALVLFAMAAGALVAFQQGLNGRVAVAAGNPLVAAMVNFTVGLVVLSVIAGVVEQVDGKPFVPPPAIWSEPVLWLGGPIGVVFVTVAAFAVRGLGVLLFSLLTIVGQLLGGLGVDLVSPTRAGQSISWQLLAAVALSILATLLAFLGSGWLRAPAGTR
jgi:transporter family-2 protein